MKLRLIVCLVAGLAPGLHAGTRPDTPLAACQPAPRAWLGVKLVKPGATVAAQLRDLPAGMGFLVTTVESDGPAGAAGLRELDVLWKMGDQMLVNESQLAALLRLHRPGDEISLGVFRGGEPVILPLRLGEAPLRPERTGGEVKEASFCEPASRVVNVSTKSASYSAEGQTATVSRAGGSYHVEIRAGDGSVLFDGQLGPDDDAGEIPEAWRRRVQVLCRTLDSALDGALPHRVQPRPRVVPPAAVEP